jgi:hypothetical protein
MHGGFGRDVPADGNLFDGGRKGGLSNAKKIREIK